MCEICHRLPCLPRCPNAEQPVAAKCADCGRDIYEGEDAFDINGDIYCENCIECAKFTAEVPEPDYD